MRWRLTIEEFVPELIYIPGENNVVADTLSCLPKYKIPDIPDSVQTAYACA